MRLHEIADENLDKYIIILKNLAGRAASKKTPAQFDWQAIEQMAKGAGIRITADYENFKTMFDNSPVLQNLVANFNADGLTLNVPGVSSDQPDQGDDETSQDKVDDIAAANAEQNLD